MPDRKRLLTILQISDLHIGQLDPVTGNAQLSKPMAQVLANFTWLDGLLGHHAFGLVDLDKFYWDLLNGKYGDVFEQEGEPLVIVSGDLTRMGDGSEFDTANEFLVSQIDLTPPHGVAVGLYYGKWPRYAIPGNHDHWPGRPVIFGGPHAKFAAYLPPTDFPFVRPPVPLSNGRVLQIIGIDTDRDVNPKGLKRLRAVGSFQGQLAAVPQIGPRQDDQIRALLMHHSWDKRGLVLSIDRGSRKALAQFLVDFGIQVILTGHTHLPLPKPFVPPVSGANAVLECRCGTTTQIDEPPYNWTTLWGTFPSRSWPENTLLVHRLYDEGVTRWYVETFTRIKGKGFVTAGPRLQSDIVV